MNTEEPTSPSVSAPTAEKDKSIPQLNTDTTTDAQQLSLALTREFDAMKDLIRENHQSRLQKLTSNPTLLVILTFVFTGLAGSILTIYQQKLAAERSFVDELNKLRIQKVGEVWERLDEDEYAIEGLLNAGDEILSKFPTANDRTKEIEKIVRSDRAMVSKYRFWLGQNISETVNKYLNANIRYSIKKLAGSSEADLKTDKEARDAAKSDVDEIRERLLRGIP